MGLHRGFKLESKFIFTVVRIDNETIYSLLKSYTLRTYRKESVSGLLCGFLSKVFLTVWMIYSMVHYFDIPDDKCTQYWPMFLYLAYGFYVLLQSFALFVWITIICVIIWFCRHHLQQPNWQGANNRVLNNLVRTRFTPANYNENEACSICLEEFKEDEEVITLPWSSRYAPSQLSNYLNRHIFHSKCILEWLPRSNACPLWKEPVSMESIQNQIQPEAEQV